MSAARRRLPLRLEKPPRGRGFRLQWLAGHLAPVSRGEPLCEAFGEGDPEPVRLLSPAAGRLHRLVPAGDRIPPAAVLGELECGPDWDAQIRRNAESARRELRQRLIPLGSDDWMSYFERYRVAEMRSLTLGGDLLRFDSRTDRYGDPPLAIRPARPERVAAALLTSLRESLSSSLRPSPAARRLMAATAERLRQKFSLGDLSDLSAPLPDAAPPETPPVASAAIRRLQAADELERRYDAEIAACAERIADFPPELRQAKLDLWRSIKQLELRRLSGEGG